MHVRLPHVRPEMLEAAFWLARCDDPDAPLLDAAGVAALNARVYDVLNMPPVLDLPDVLEADSLRGEMWPDDDRAYYDVTGALLAAETWEALRANAALELLPDMVSVRYGLVTQRTPVRSYPTAMLALRENGSLFFDHFQQTTVDVGWPLAVVHTSADGEWFFALTPLYWGWLRARDVALSDRATVREYVQGEPFAVAVAPWAGIALPDGHHATAQMGTRLLLAGPPLAGRDGDVLRLFVPRRDRAGRLILAEGYAADGPDWQAGYLPCTLRSVFTQAFRMLGERYAWGGMRLGQRGRDCSRFVRDVWAATGVHLPRNSGQQGRVGVTVACFSEGDSPAARAEVLGRDAPPGALLILPGHVMLYLGSVEGRPYAIHDLWKYRHPEGHLTLAGAVVVSDLPLEPSAERHTLLERLTHVQVVG